MFSFLSNSIAMLYLAHKYKKKFKSTNRDLTFVVYDFFLAFLVSGYICLKCHENVPFATSCKVTPVFGHR